MKLPSEQVSDLPRQVYADVEAMPDEFDARTKWPKCHTIGDIYAQGRCNAYWVGILIRMQTRGEATGNSPFPNVRLYLITKMKATTLRSYFLWAKLVKQIPIESGGPV